MGRSERDRGPCGEEHSPDSLARRHVADSSPFVVGVQSFNSWDRQSYFWEEDGATHTKPEMQLIQHNLILNKDFQ